MIRKKNTIKNYNLISNMSLKQNDRWAEAQYEIEQEKAKKIINPKKHEKHNNHS